MNHRLLVPSAASLRAYSVLFIVIYVLFWGKNPGGVLKDTFGIGKEPLNFVSNSRGTGEGNLF